MQILYGNDGVNYRLLDKSGTMSDGVQKSMLATYSKYEFVSKARLYSAVGNEPEAITYVTSNLDNQMPTEDLVICKTGHMSQYSSPSYYFHGIVKDVPEEFYKRDFFEIFSYQFVKDIDVAHFVGGSVDGYDYAAQQLQFAPLTNDQLIVILATFMSNEKKGQKTKIIVDASGDEYNFRSREILASIYRYLPYELRKRYGFKTYAQEDKGLPARVSFVLFNRDEVNDAEDAITLSEKAADIENVIAAQYVSYAKYLVEELGEAQREEHFMAVSKLAKNGRLTIDDCLTYYNSVQKWSHGTQEELLPEWIQYVDQNSFKKGPLYEMLLELIVERVDNQYYNNYLFDSVLRLYQESIYNLTPNAAKVIRFADCLDEIFIEPARFSEWYREQLNEKVLRAKGVVEVEQIYDEEIRLLSDINIMSDELDELLKAEISYINEKKASLSGNIEQQKMDELEEMGRRIGTMSELPIDAFVMEVLGVWSKIQFEENKQELIPTVEEWLDGHFQESFKKPSALEAYVQSFTQLKGIISNEKFKQYGSILNDAIARMREEKQARTFVIEKDLLLKSYGEMACYLKDGVLDLTDKVTMKLGHITDTPNVSTVKNLLEFLLAPNAKNFRDAGPLVQGFLKTFVLEELLHVEHAKYLMRMNGEKEILAVLDYYLKSASRIKISGLYLAGLLSEYHPELINTFADLYEDEDGEAGIFAEELKRFARKPGRSREDDEKRGSSERRGGFGFFGGKK